jgi:outer membrane protein assembly factor BamB
VFRRRLWLSAVIVLVAGCGTPVYAQKPTGWIRSDLKPVSQPVLANGHLVLYVEAGGGLEVVALDPLTGRTLWHDTASPGYTAPGVSPALGVAGSIVTFLRPVGNSAGSSQVVGVDAATGRWVWRSPTGAFTDWPRSCVGDPSVICATGSVGGAPQLTAWRSQGSNGDQLQTVVIPQSSGGRILADDLFDPGNRKPEELAAVNGGSVAWTRPLASVFPTPGMSTDYGWDFDRVPAAGLFVGSVGPKPLSLTKTSMTTSLSQNMTAGFRISDGTAVWRDSGTVYACGQPLPCPGTLGESYRPPTTGLRLRTTGTISYPPQAAPTTLSMSHGADVKVEGFDLATGKTLWSYDAGPDGSLLSQTPPLLGPYVVALPSPTGRTVALNLATGTHNLVRAGAMAWCSSTVTYRTRVGYRIPFGKSQYVRVGQQSIRPCRVSGAPVAIPKTVPGFVGTTVDGLTVWSGPDELAATPTRP